MFPRLLGTGKSLEMFCMGRSLSAPEAVTSGLVTAVFSSQEFDTRVDMELAILAGMPAKVCLCQPFIVTPLTKHDVFFSQSVSVCKSLMRRWTKSALHAANDAETAALRERWTSEECMEAVAKFFSLRAKL